MRVKDVSLSDPKWQVIAHKIAGFYILNGTKDAISIGSNFMCCNHELNSS